MESILEEYYADNAKKLHNMVDKILFKLGFSGLTDYEDFYSIANEVFADVIKRYDGVQTFDIFLYSCLCNRFKSEMTRRNRQKRQVDRMSISIDIPIEGDENSTLGDMIADKFDIEKEVFEEKEEGYSRRMLLYLSKLSNLQKKVLELSMAGYSANEIKEELHITERQYSDCNVAIHSYRNVSVLY